jgi:hypothetical protein
LFHYADNATIYAEVTRDDNGYESFKSDWFDLCKLSSLREQGVVAVAFFIDIMAVWVFMR